MNEQPTCGKILLYLNKQLEGLNYGSRLMIIKRPQHIKLPSNPYQLLWINDDFKIKTSQIPIEVDYCLILTISVLKNSYKLIDQNRLF